ncbi:hypothetical protein [Streptomyces sp. NPDC059063]
MSSKHRTRLRGRRGAAAQARIPLAPRLCDRAGTAGPPVKGEMGDT